MRQRAKWKAERDELIAALKAARDIIREDYRDEALTDGYWPTLKPRIDAIDAVIAKTPVEPPRRKKA